MRYVPHLLVTAISDRLNLTPTRPVNQALDRVYLLPKIRKKCLKLSYRMCGQHAFLPKAMKIHAEYDRTGFALYRGGSADVWKGIYCGRDVAVKVIRTYSDSDPRRIIGVGYMLCILSRVDALTRACIEVLQGGRDMENPSTSERPTADRSDDVRK